MKKVTQLAAAIALTAGTMTAAPVAMAEVSGSVAIASSYLWRGFDLGNGTPAVSGDLSVSEAGFYSGIWVSSGDTTYGTEYDLYAGWGGEFGGLTVDLSVWNYVYPTGTFDGTGEVDLGSVAVSRFSDNGDTFGDLSEVILTLGYGPVSFSYYDNIAGSSGYEYYTLDASMGKFSATLGMHSPDEGDEPVHLNINYHHTDNLTFTVSQFVADEDEVDDDLNFVVSYSLPLDM